MKVLLRQSVEKIGERGEIVNVADGFARNYLLPRGFAVAATSANFKQLEVEKVRIAKQAEKERAEMGEKRARLEGVSCTITAAVSPEGHLYGSVGPREIAEAFGRDGVEIDPKTVRLEEPFKEAGVYLVPVELASELVATTRVWIVPES